MALHLKDMKEIGKAFNVHLDTRLTPKEVEEMASAIPRVQDNDAKRLAAILMIHFSQEKGVLPPSSNADHLIFFLDGGAHNLPDADPYLRNMTRDLFESYTPDQGRAIHRWLIEVARVRFVRLCANDVESAIQYWSARTAPPANPSTVKK
jgi:hypothetical protein